MTWPTLLDRYLGRRWAEDPDNIKIWERINRIPDSGALADP